MRFMVDMSHPAHVHFFRPFIAEMGVRGHQFLIASRKKDITVDLLVAYGLAHQTLSEQRKGAINLAAELILRTARFVHLARSYKPDYLLGVMGPVITLASAVLPARSVVFYDNEMTAKLNQFAATFGYAWWSPRAYRLDHGRKHFRYDGYPALAYLHPNRFTPDEAIVRSYGINPDAPYFIVRFVSWESLHDFGEEGFTLEQKRRLFRLLEPCGQIFVTSEGGLPSEFEPYRLAISVEHIHHVIAFAHLLVGESSTMASEAACLGTHSLFVSKSGRGVNYEQEERYCLVHNFTGGTSEESLKCVQTLLSRPDLKQDAMRRRDALLRDTIDVTGFFINYFESDCEVVD